MIAPFASQTPYGYNQTVMEHTRIELPGFGLPVNHYELDEDCGFPSCLNTTHLVEDRTA